MKNILFVGGHYDHHILNYLLNNSKHGLDFAANNLQEAIFKGLDENEADYSVISFPYVGSYPLHSKSPFVKSYSSPDNKIRSIGYANIIYIKRWDVKRRCWRLIKEWCVAVKNETVIVFYNFSNISTARKIKKKFPFVKVLLIVTDLPEYMSTDHSLVSRINDKLLKFNSADFHNYIDGYILIAKRMADRMPISCKPQLLLEGIYNSMTFVGNVKKNPQKTILYTGTLGARYGIRTLLEAFSLIEDPNYRLWIRGNGQCEDEVKIASAKDNRIVYFEKMSREELLMLEKKATILINPVSPSQEFTPYFFPSKTLEYLASGTPTVMYKLECIPPEYMEYIYTIEGEDAQSMKDKIVEVCEKNSEELQEFGMKASRFILANKTPKPQISRLLNFIESV